jgi:hypothetical protein
MSRLSPVELDCPTCNGIGWVTATSWALCPICRGVGKAWIPGAPGFGCKITLSQRRVGEIVTLGNGDRGRIVRHDKRATPTTSIALIGDFDQRESSYPTAYPSCVGVASVSDPRWISDDSNHSHDRDDQVDPMRKATR